MTGHRRCRRAVIVKTAGLSNTPVQAASARRSQLSRVMVTALYSLRTPSSRHLFGSLKVVQSLTGTLGGEDSQAFLNIGADPAVH